MKQEDIYAMLAECGFPVYRDYADIVEWGKLPYLVYLTTQDRPLGSDLEVLAWWHHVQVELYTRRVDLAAEEAVRGVLLRAGIPYQCVREPLPEDNLCVTVFEFDVLEA